MANGNRRTKGTFSRTVAPFAPLAVALVMGALLPSGQTNVSETEVGTETEAAVCGGDISDFQDCHSRFPTGCSASGGYDSYLNLLKNQLTPAPASQPATFFNSLTQFEDLDSQIPDGLTSKNHDNFKDDLGKVGEGKLFGVIGYLYYAKKTSAESSNCEISDNGVAEGTDVDFHIGIGFDPSLAKKVSPTTAPKGTLLKELEQQSVIVEMTPHYRFNFKQGIWTIDNLQQAVGKKVRVVGQLIVDSEHNIASQNCSIASTAKEKQSCWRASVWELHPVVEFQVCKTDSCQADSPASDWAELDQLGGASPSGTASSRPASRKSQTSEVAGNRADGHAISR